MTHDVWGALNDGVELFKGSWNHGGHHENTRAISKVNLWIPKIQSSKFVRNLWEVFNSSKKLASINDWIYKDINGLTALLINSLFVSKEWVNIVLKNVLVTYTPPNSERH